MGFRKPATQIPRLRLVFLQKSFRAGCGDGKLAPLLPKDLREGLQGIITSPFYKSFQAQKSKWM
jgi:hypothetical protein